MSELTKKDKAKAMRNGQMKMAKEGCVWTIEDDLLLRDMFEDGDDVLDMALMLERKEPAIQQRIDQLNLYSKQKTYPHEEGDSHRPTRVLMQTLHDGQSILSPLPPL